MRGARLGKALGEPTVVGWDTGGQDRVVKSAGRVLRILELFDILKREASVSEVADLLEYPQSSTSVLLRSMVVLGYLSCNSETRAYSPTTRVALLGSWINGPLVSEGVLLRLLERVNLRTEQAVILAVRNQIWAEYIHVIQAISPVRLFVVKGSMRPLVRSASGLSILADLPDPEIKRICTRYNAFPPEKGPRVSRSTLLEQVCEVREKGYSFNCDTVTPGGGAICMRLPQIANEERFVIGIAAPTETLRQREEEIVSVLHDEISAYMAAKRGLGRPPMQSSWAC